MLIIGLLLYFNFAMSKSLVVNSNMESAVNILGMSLLGLLHRKIIAKEMHYITHLWCEKVDLKGKPYPIFEIYIIIACLIFLIISAIVLVKEFLPIL